MGKGWLDCHPCADSALNQICMGKQVVYVKKDDMRFQELWTESLFICVFCETGDSGSVVCHLA